MRKNLSIDSKKKQTISSEQSIEASGRKDIAIKIIFQLISRALLGKIELKTLHQAKEND